MIFGKDFTFYFLECLRIKVLFHSLCIYPFEKKLYNILILIKSQCSVSIKFVQIYSLQTNIAKNDCILDWIRKWYFRQCPCKDAPCLSPSGYFHVLGLPCVCDEKLKDLT